MDLGFDGLEKLGYALHNGTDKICYLEYSICKVCYGTNRLESALKERLFYAEREYVNKSFG